MSERIENLKLCAEALEYSVVKGDGRYKNGMAIATADGDPVTNWDPYTNDAQAMALVKAMELSIHSGVRGWQVIWTDGEEAIDAINSDLNTAIVNCAAAVQRSRKERE